MDIEHLPNWAASAGQRPIELYKSPLQEGIQHAHPLIFIGGVHGDEPEGVRLAGDLLTWLKTQNQSTLLPWILIPCLNPDGYTKNDRTNANGVDLNRNYPASNWSSEYKQPRYYPGPHAGSEPEIKALCQLISDTQPQLILHFHSWQACVVVTGPADLPAGQFLADSSGYELKNDIGYATPGSLSQYGWVDHSIPVICTEEQEHSDLNNTWKNFGPALIKILKL